MTATRYFCRLFGLGGKGRGKDAFKQPIVGLNHLYTKEREVLMFCPHLRGMPRGVVCAAAFSGVS